MPETKLKPCPFCGGEVIFAIDNYGKFLIECESCAMFFGVQLECGTELTDGWRAIIDTPEIAVEAWNRRTDNE